MNANIQSIKPFNFSGGQAVEAIGLSGGQTIKMIFWNHPLQGSIQPGVTVDIREDGKTSKWDNYKGEDRFNIRDKASVTILPGGATPQYTPPVQQAAQQAPYGATAYIPAPEPAPAYQAAVAAPEGKGEAVLARAAELQHFYVSQLEARGFSRDEAITISSGAGNAAEITAKWWFGEKGA